MQQQKLMLKKIADRMKKEGPSDQLDNLLAKVLEMELSEQDRELVGEWERNNKES